MTRLHPPKSEQDLYLQLERIINGGLDLGNLRGGRIEFETTGAQQRLRHALGSVPSGWTLVRREGPVQLWAEDVKSWTSQELILNSDKAGVTCVIFVQ